MSATKALVLAYDPAIVRAVDLDKTLTLGDAVAAVDEFADAVSNVWVDAKWYDGDDTIPPTPAEVKQYIAERIRDVRVQLLLATEKGA